MDPYILSYRFLFHIWANFDQPFSVAPGPTFAVQIDNFSYTFLARVAWHILMSPALPTLVPIPNSRSTFLECHR